MNENYFSSKQVTFHDTKTFSFDITSKGLHGVIRPCVHSRSFSCILIECPIYWYNFFYFITFYQFSEDLHQWNFPILYLFGMIKEKINFIFLFLTYSMILMFLYHFDIYVISCLLLSVAAILSLNLKKWLKNEWLNSTRECWIIWRHTEVNIYILPCFFTVKGFDVYVIPLQPLFFPFVRF